MYVMYAAVKAGEATEGNGQEEEDDDWSRGISKDVVVEGWIRCTRKNVLPLGRITMHPMYFLLAHRFISQCSGDILTLMKIIIIW